jgi:hypothetical protein
VRTGAGEKGQASPEYVGLILMVALVASAFAAVNLGPGIAGSLQSAFCHAIGAGCDPGIAILEPPTERELLDNALAASLVDFQAIKDSPDHDPRMDYTDDGCSAPVLGSETFWFHFREACERHDFGYRNSKRLGLFGEYKRRIDATFAEDMVNACEAESWWQRGPCRDTASLYLSAVTLGGGFCDLPGNLGRVPGPCAPEHG